MPLTSSLYSLFVEYLEAVEWAFPSDDAQTNTTFLTVDCCLSIWAKPAPSLVNKNWEVIHLIIADISHRSWGCWSLDASGGTVHILLSLGWPSLLLPTVDKCIGNLQPECLELFVLLHTKAFGISAIQQPSIVDGYISHLPKEAHVPSVWFWRGTVQGHHHVSKVNSSHVDIILWHNVWTRNTNSSSLLSGESLDFFKRAYSSTGAS